MKEKKKLVKSEGRELEPKLLAGILNWRQNRKKIEIFPFRKMKKDSSKSGENLVYKNLSLVNTTVTKRQFPTRNVSKLVAKKRD